jgi:branched-chain amino acid aminotransferase
MGIESRFIWMDGKLVPFADANVHVLSHTLHYGLGVFEGIRAYKQSGGGGGGVWKLDEHIRRLTDSAKMCRFEMPWTHEQIRSACVETLQANEMEECYIRPIIYLGMGAMGIGARNNPIHLTVAVWNWGKYLGEEGIRNGIRVQTSTFTRHHVNSNLQRAKVIGHYVNSILARYEADDNGYDEAIMLDGAGYVAEGTGENLFCARDGVVKTPPVVNILGGITRRTVIDILQRDGVPVYEMHFGRDALYVADEVFLTGTAAEITPVREVDRRAVGTPGRITRNVQEIYTAGVRGEIEWMRPYITTF